jgi:hypothetical protein
MELPEQSNTRIDNVVLLICPRFAAAAGLAIPAVTAWQHWGKYVMSDYFDHELDRILKEVRQRNEAAARAKMGKTKLSFREEFEGFRASSLAPALKSISDRLTSRGIQNAVVTEKQEGKDGTSEPYILIQIVHDPIERFQRAQISTFPYLEFRCDSQKERVVLNRTAIGPNRINTVVGDGEAGLGDLDDAFVQKKVLALVQEFSTQF